MIENNHLELGFANVRGKKVAVGFDGGVVTSEAWFLLLRETACGINISDRLSECIIDKRDGRYIDHTVQERMRQRTFQTAYGYENADDSDSFRDDPALKGACGREPLYNLVLGTT
jgi:hypothetical protein